MMVEHYSIHINNTHTQNTRTDTGPPPRRANSPISLGISPPQVAGEEVGEVGRAACATAVAQGRPALGGELLC